MDEGPEGQAGQRYRESAASVPGPFAALKAAKVPLSAQSRQQQFRAHPGSDPGALLKGCGFEIIIERGEVDAKSLEHLKTMTLASRFAGRPPKTLATVTSCLVARPLCSIMSDQRVKTGRRRRVWHAWTSTSAQDGTGDLRSRFGDTSERHHRLWRRARRSDLP